MSLELQERPTETTVKHGSETVTSIADADAPTPVLSEWGQGRSMWGGQASDDAASTAILTFPGRERDQITKVGEALRAYESRRPTVTSTSTLTIAATVAERLLRDLLSASIAMFTARAFETLREVVTSQEAHRDAEYLKHPEYRAFKELGRWLRAPDEEIAAMVGVGRTTPYAWARDQRTPRPEAARKLYQTHAVVASLVQLLGEDAAIRWLCDEDPLRRARLLRGDLAAVQREAQRVVFPSPRRPRPGSWIPDDAEDDELD